MQRNWRITQISYYKNFCNIDIDTAEKGRPKIKTVSLKKKDFFKLIAQAEKWDDPDYNYWTEGRSEG